MSDEEITDEDKEIARRLVGEPLDPPSDPLDQFLYGAYAENRRIQRRIEDGNTGPNFTYEVRAQKVSDEQVNPEAPSGTKIAQAIEESFQENDVSYEADHVWKAAQAVKDLLAGDD